MKVAGWVAVGLVGWAEVDGNGLGYWVGVGVDSSIFSTPMAGQLIEPLF